MANCDPSISLGFTLDDDGTCGSGPTDLPNTDPMLGALTPDAVPTVALLPGSPAIDVIPVADCTEPADQRGIARPQGAGCDIGAFERIQFTCGIGPELALLTPALAFAQDAAANEFDSNAWIGLATGLGMALAAFGGALGQGRTAATALEGISRNPGAADKLFTPMILGLALIESLVIYSLIISIMLLGKIS